MRKVHRKEIDGDLRDFGFWQRAIGKYQSIRNFYVAGKIYGGDNFSD
jgi:hypothetical protein